MIMKSKLVNLRQFSPMRTYKFVNMSEGWNRVAIYISGFGLSQSIMATIFLWGNMDDIARWIVSIIICGLIALSYIALTHKQ